MARGNEAHLARLRIDEDSLPEADGVALAVVALANGQAHLDTARYDHANTLGGAATKNKTKVEYL